ncbi:MAG: GntR family transcriptional regulator [Acidobacteria bacterium]|nr:GntR family transcriptional regulator [Acidobacteriota bacterium]
MRLNKHSFTPLYHQIEQALRRQIKEGVLIPGSAISERELSEQLGVSRMTARQALSALRDEGLIYTARGRGTFVAEPKLDVHTRQLHGFSEDMRRRGLTPTSRVLGFRRSAATEVVREKLDLGQLEEVYEIERLRLADGAPMAWEVCQVPVGLGIEIGPADLEQGSLYQLLEESGGIRLHEAYELLEAASATMREAELLRISHRSPVLIVERTVRDIEHRPIEYVRSVYRGDRYQARIRLKRK